MATPLEFVVAFCVVLPPLGVVNVNITLAPEAAAPPLVTEAVMGTVPGREKFAPDTETSTANDGGVITVAFAVPRVVAALVAAFNCTAYVPAGVPDGAPFASATEAD